MKMGFQSCLKEAQTAGRCANLEQSDQDSWLGQSVPHAWLLSIPKMLKRLLKSVRLNKLTHRE